MKRKDASTFSFIFFVITLVYVSIFLLNSAIAVSSTPRGFSIKMTRSESPLYQKDDLTLGKRFQRLVEQSKARARYFGSTNKGSMNPDIVRVPLEFIRQTHYYLGQVGFGSFYNQPQTFKNYYLIIDTACDLTWTQCQGGIFYFHQDAPYYPNQDSSTYRRIPCEDYANLCTGERCSQDGFCRYHVAYAGGKETAGYLAYETLTINSNTGEHALESIINVVMGCGFYQRNFGPVLGVPEIDVGNREPLPGPLPQPGTAPVTGILGLGNGDATSLIQQLSEFGSRFEYCLQPYDITGVAGSHTYLRFGSDAVIGNGPEVLRTPIIQNENFPTFYHLILEGISVGERRLGFGIHDFEIKPGGTGGTIIDSGAPFSVLYMPHFDRVRQAMVEYFEALHIHPADPDPDHNSFDLCFFIPADFKDYPTVTLHFHQADFVIRKSGIFVQYSPTYICFGMLRMENDDHGGDVNDFILGAMQQADKRILYDVSNMELSFTDENCRLGS